MISLRRKKALPIGLHVSARSVTMAQIREQAGRQSLYAFAREELPAPTEELSQFDRETQILKVIRGLLVRHHFQGRTAVGCLTMEDLFVQAVRLPKMPDEATEKIIQSEAAERLPYPCEEAEYRYWHAAEIRQESDVKQEVLLLACRKTAVERLIGLLEGASLRPMAIDVEPCAVSRGLGQTTGDETSTGRRVSVNFGEQATTVMIEAADRIVFLKQVSDGGRELDHAVANHLRLGANEAAQLRAAVTNSSSLDNENEVHRSVIDAIRQPLERLSHEIQMCLRYDKVAFRGQPPKKIIVTGPEASPWLAEFLSEWLQTPCRLCQPLENMDLAMKNQTVPKVPWQWTTAIGLSRKLCDSAES